MPCLECGCKMEIVGDNEIEDGDDLIVEIIYECPGCGNGIVVIDG